MTLRLLCIWLVFYSLLTKLSVCLYRKQIHHIWHNTYVFVTLGTSSCLSSRFLSICGSRRVWIFARSRVFWPNVSYCHHLSFVMVVGITPFSSIGAMVRRWWCVYGCEWLLFLAALRGFFFPEQFRKGQDRTFVSVCLRRTWSRGHGT
jgi:hypothetical protein